jgi:hypothetical protein
MRESYQFLCEFYGIVRLRHNNIMIIDTTTQQYGNKDTMGDRGGRALLHFADDA